MRSDAIQMAKSNGKWDWISLLVNESEDELTGIQTEQRCSHSA